MHTTCEGGSKAKPPWQCFASHCKACPSYEVREPEEGSANTLSRPDGIRVLCSAGFTCAAKQSIASTKSEGSRLLRDSINSWLPCFADFVPVARGAIINFVAARRVRPVDHRQIKTELTASVTSKVSYALKKEDQRLYE